MGYAPLWRSLRSNLGHFEIASVRRNLVVNSLPPCKREEETLMSSEVRVEP